VKDLDQHKYHTESTGCQLSISNRASSEAKLGYFSIKF